MLRINSVKDVGDLDRERVVLRALQDTDLANYAVFSCLVFDDKQIESGDIPDVFWFESMDLKTGDFVVLYTKEGTERTKVSERGNKSYFYYWSKKQAIWTEQRRAILVNTTDWTSAEEDQQTE